MIDPQFMNEEMKSFFLVYVEYQHQKVKKNYFARAGSCRKRRESIFPTCVRVYKTLWHAKEQKAENKFYKKSFSDKKTTILPTWGGPFEGQEVCYAYFANIKDLVEFYGAFVEKIGDTEKIKDGMQGEFKYAILIRNQRAREERTLPILRRIYPTREGLESAMTLNYNMEGRVEEIRHHYDPKTYYVNYIIKTSLSNEVLKIGYTTSLHFLEGRLQSYYTHLPGLDVLAVVLIPEGGEEGRLDTKIKKQFPDNQHQQANGSATEWLEYIPGIIEAYFGYLGYEDGEGEDQQQVPLFEVTPQEMIDRFE